MLLRLSVTYALPYNCMLTALLSLLYMAVAKI